MRLVHGWIRYTIKNGTGLCTHHSLVNRRKANVFKLTDARVLKQGRNLCTAASFEDLHGTHIDE